MSLEKPQTIDGAQRSRLITEFNYLKIISLVLLIFVHSDLIIAYPNVMYPIQWFLLSAFFFISGYLAYESFHKRQNSMRTFFKSKFNHLYIPFAIAVVFYFVMEVTLGIQANFIKLATQLSMLNILDAINAILNWGSLWFIPYLLLFMLIICLLEKYVKSIKIQLVLLGLVWISSILLWAYDSPFRLGQLFSQFILVFSFGFFVNKIRLYDKMLTSKTTLLAVPLFAVFAVDMLGFLSFSTPLQAFEALLYSNIRVTVLTTSLVLLVLLVFRTVKVPKNGLAKKIATRSAFIYLSEPFISYLILTYLFAAPDNLFIIGGPLFIAYQIVRIIVLLLLVPLVFVAWNKYRSGRGTL